MFHASREGHQVLSQLFGRNDLFTAMFTARIGLGKLQWGILINTHTYLSLAADWSDVTRWTVPATGVLSKPFFHPGETIFARRFARTASSRYKCASL
jgi:hypothetical protein